MVRNVIPAWTLDERSIRIPISGHAPTSCLPMPTTRTMRRVASFFLLIPEFQALQGNRFW